MAETNASEQQDRGLFGLIGKKKEEKEPEHHGEDDGKPHKVGLMDKLHRSNSSSSSSSSDEEGGEKGEEKKKKKKKGGEDDKEKKEGLIDKIKEKLPGHHNKDEEKVE